jgi:hypothetical protein
MSERTQIFIEPFKQPSILSDPYNISERHICIPYPNNYSGHYLSASPTVKRAANTNSERNRRIDINEVFNDILTGLSSFKDNFIAFAESAWSKLINLIDGIVSSITGVIKKFEIKLSSLRAELSLKLHETDRALRMLKNDIGKDLLRETGNYTKKIKKALAKSPELLGEAERILASHPMVQKMNGIIDTLKDKISFFSKYAEGKVANSFKWVDDLLGKLSLGKAGPLAIADVVLKIGQTIDAAFKEGERFDTNKEGSFWYNLCAVCIAILLICLAIKFGLVVAVALGIAGAVFAVIEICTGTDWLTYGVIAWGNKLASLVLD